MCPLCLTSIAVAVAAKIGAGAAVTTAVVRATRSLTGLRALHPRKRDQP
jgi:hypothetical protein